MTAVNAGLSAWKEEYNQTGEQFNWDDYAARLARYEHNEHYYSNRAYSTLQKYSERYKAKHKLYKNIRSIYNPVKRLVDFYVANVYGGSIDMESFDSGAIPIVTDNEDLIAAIRQVFIWSNWQSKKSLFVRNGAKLGDVFIKAVDDSDAAKVRAEIVHPSRIKELTIDAVGNIKRVAIEYEVDEPPPFSVPGRKPQESLRTFTRTEEITQDAFRFYRDGELWDYTDNIRNGPLAEYENEYGFVPMVHAAHQDEGHIFGANCFYAESGKIDETNDSASLLNDQIRKAVVAVFGVSGTNGPNKIEAHADDRDQMRIIKLPEGAQIQPFIAPLDFAAGLQNIDSMLSELERDMPELALHRIRMKGELTAPGVRAGFSDAIGKVQEARANYDGATVRFLQMCISMGGLRQYRGFEPFGLESYAKGDLEFYVGERDVIEDQMTRKERVEALQAAGAPIRLLMEEMGGYSENDILLAESAKESQARNEMRGFADAIFGGTEEPDDEEPDDEPATEDTEA